MFLVTAQTIWNDLDTCRVCARSEVRESHQGSDSTSASLKNSVCRYRILLWTLLSKESRGAQPLSAVRKLTFDSIVIGPDAVWPCSAVAP